MKLRAVLSCVVALVACAGEEGDPPRAELEPGVQAGQEAERDPGLGDRLPRRPDLRDLDEVVHQREAGQSDLVRCERDAAQPVGGILAPREAGDLEHDAGPAAPRRR